MKSSLIIFFTICALLVGCSMQKADDNANRPGPSVSSEQAKQAATQEYHLSNIESVELRHLTKVKWQNLTNEQKEFTPVYYVMTRKKDGNVITVYVSSNNVFHHFVVSE